MQKITPFLWFDKNAEEAMNFYCSIFKSAKIVSIKRYPEGNLEGPMKGMEGKVLTAVFELEGQTFMALDGGPFFKPTSAVSFYIECKDQEEVDYYWNKLAEGGDEKAQQCGWLMDKFGFSWQVIPSALPELLNNSDKDLSNRVLQAMLKMKKIDVNTLKKAAEGK
ncbi:MAG TPA: VOC family protein [Candidatus Paceibacterota bacterium]|jgi:predicted 3-demethylubiquinone-9 3-methyltransferase (glyoxalase superfamily)|nr:VOC family protein [Candidatus Paceibacterota bacterium]